MGKAELTRRDYVLHKLYPANCKYADKDYAFADAVSHLAKYGDERKLGFGNPYIKAEDKEKVLACIKAWISQHEGEQSWVGDLASFERKALTKWYGPQGATPTHEEVMQVVSEYYNRAINFEPSYVLSDTTKFEFKQQLSIKSWRLLKPTELYRRYKGDRRSNSALTGWKDRRTPGIRVRAISEAVKDPYCIDPIVVGTRDQRSKKPCRCIFMDSFSNYYREVQAFSMFEASLKESDCVAWRGDRYIEKSYYDFAKSASRLLHCEFDYEMMDSWCEKGHMKWTLNQFYDAIDVDKNLREYQFKMTQELFRAPLWTPEGEIQGFHALFSGIYPTNPFETPLNFLIIESFVHDVLEKILKRSLILGVDYILFVLGDDSLLVFKDGVADALADQIGSLFSVWVWQNFHIKANAEKQRVSFTSGFFCKRQYKKDGAQYSPFEGSTLTFPKSLYPLTLACLSIFEPEDGALDSKAQSLLKLFQVFDNAWGHPIWKMILRKVWEIVPDLHIQVTDEDVEKYNSETNKNWRLIVLGEKFSLEKSPTAQVWATWSK